ncbi:MAG: tetratricopeptide repeat protein [Ancrocorticia sp.]
MSQPLASSMYGAVDLSSLASAAPGAGALGAAGVPGVSGAGAASGAIPGPYVLDVTPENLRGVLETSASVPVIMVFFAESVEQSLSLVAQLEGFAGEAQGHFQLGKVDAVTYPEVAQAFGVGGIPAAVALMQGQPIPLFQGIPQEGELAPLCNRVMEAAQQNGLFGVLDGDADGEPPAPPRPPHQAAGLDALDAGDIETAHAEFVQAIKDNPGDTESKVLLFQVELIQRVQAIEDPLVVLQAAAQAKLGDIEAHLAAADVEFYSRRAEAAFARLLDVIRVTSGKERDKARERLLELFEIVGKDHPAVAAARRELASALF